MYVRNIIKQWLSESIGLFHNKSEKLSICMLNQSIWPMRLILNATRSQNMNT